LTPWKVGSHQRQSTTALPTKQELYWRFCCKVPFQNVKYPLSENSFFQIVTRCEYRIHVCLEHYGCSKFPIRHHLARSLVCKPHWRISQEIMNTRSKPHHDNCMAGSCILLVSWIQCPLERSDSSQISTRMPITNYMPPQMKRALAIEALELQAHMEPKLRTATLPFLCWMQLSSGSMKT